MKKKLFSLLLFVMMFVPLTFVKAEDQYFITKKKASLSESEYDHSVFAAGDVVRSESKVNGAFFGAGNSVKVSGDIDYGFLAGQTLEVNSIVEHDLFAAGGSIVLSKESAINRDIYLAANNVDIRTNILGNAWIAGSIVTLDNIVITGDLRVYANQLIINENVEIKGTLYISEGTFIENENNLKFGNKEIIKVNRVDIKNKVSDVILSILTLIFTAIVLALVFPKLFSKLDYELTVKDVFKKMFIGLGVLVIVPILSVILFVTSVGVSLGAILLLLYIIGIMISTILSSYVIGYNVYTKAFDQKDNIYVDLLIGILIVKVIELIPVIGALFMFAAFIYGLGLLYKLILVENK